MSELVPLRQSTVRQVQSDADGGRDASDGVAPRPCEVGGPVRYGSMGSGCRLVCGPIRPIAYSGAQIGVQGTAGQQSGFVEQEFMTASKRPESVRCFARRQAAEHGFSEELQMITTVRFISKLSHIRRTGVILARQLSDIAGQSVRVSGAATEGS